MGLGGRMCWEEAWGILLKWLDRVLLPNWTSLRCESSHR